MGAKRRLVWRGLVAAAIVAACVDGPTAPGRLGELRFRPVYPAADEPDALGVAPESAAVRITRRTDPATVLVDATVVYATDTSSLAWIVDLEASAESLDVLVNLWGQGVRLYSGSDALLVEDGVLSDAAAEPVAVGYVGPPIVTSVTVNPPDVTLDSLGKTTSLQAVARDRDGAVVPGAAFGWTTDHADVATVHPATGVVTAVAGGTATITATSGTASGTALVTVNPTASVASIVVTPAVATLGQVGATQPFAALAYDAGGNVLGGVRFIWTSSANGVATVDSTGVARAAGHGTTVVTAAAGSVVGNATLTVDLGTAIATVTVTPAAATLAAPGATQPFAAAAFDAGGNPVPVASFAWSSSAPDVATVDAVTGLATAVKHGGTSITATVAGKSGSASLSVNLESTVDRVVVSPAAVTVHSTGATQQFTAVALDANDAVVPGIVFAWTSSAPAVGGVDATGLATAVGHGETVIQASAGTVTGTAVLAVDLVPAVDTIIVSPAAASLDALDATVTFTAVAQDAAGNVLPGVPVVWSSADTGVAMVEPATGVATARGNGATVITAVAGGVSGTAALDVVQRVVSIAITPDSARLTGLEQFQQFAAHAFDANGHAVTNVTFLWSSSDVTVARIDATGRAESRKFGTTAITASAQGVTGAAVLVVQQLQGGGDL